MIATFYIYICSWRGLGCRNAQDLHLTDCMVVVNYQLVLIMSTITCCLYLLEGKWHVSQFQPLFCEIFCVHTINPCIFHQDYTCGTVFQQRCTDISADNSYRMLSVTKIDQIVVEIIIYIYIYINTHIMTLTKHQAHCAAYRLGLENTV